MKKDPLYHCLEAIALKFNEGQVEQWTDGTFVHLSELIEEETGIIISRNTLKRLYGKMKTPDDYKPQKETRNALAIYAGYKDWEEVSREIRVQNAEDGEEETGPIFSFQHKLHTFKKKRSRFLIYIRKYREWFFYGLLLLTGFSALLLFFPKDENSNPILEPSAEMTILNPIDTVPYTLKISYKTNHVEDSLFLDRHQITTNAVKYNLSIQVPVYTWLNLDYKNKLLVTQPYHAVSKNWMAFYQHKRKKNFYYIKPKFSKQKGIARISKKWFEGKILDSTGFFYYLKNFRNFPLDADNFTLECKTKINRDELDCGSILFVTVGANGHLETCLNSRSCANHNYFYLSDLILEGEYTDFPKLDIKSNVWAIIRMEVKNKQVKVFADNVLVYEGAYTKSVGQIKGFSLKFQGFGSVDYFKAWDAKGTLVEDESFD